MIMIDFKVFELYWDYIFIILNNFEFILVRRYVVLKYFYRMVLLFLVFEIFL